MNSLIKCILAIFLPPLTAFLQVGISTHFWINVVLSLLGWVPGVLHAIWLVVTNQKA